MSGEVGGGNPCSVQGYLLPYCLPLATGLTRGGDSLDRTEDIPLDRTGVRSPWGYPSSWLQAWSEATLIKDLKQKSHETRGTPHLLCIRTVIRPDVKVSEHFWNDSPVLFCIDWDLSVLLFTVLPTTYVVWGKVMFSLVSVILFSGEGRRRVHLVLVLSGVNRGRWGTLTKSGLGKREVT